MSEAPGAGPLTYAGSGVNYEQIDPFKRLAQEAARATAGNIERLGVREFTPSRGESAFLVETPHAYLAHVEEGLGTKNRVADAMRRITGRSFYDHIARDTVATIVNDLITVGALPLSVAMHLAVGASEWFADEMRAADLVRGWKEACDLARCVWGGGETPTLKGILEPEAALLGGSALGIVQPKERLIAPRLAHGDTILLLASNGIHANGLTLAQSIAAKLPDGYLTPLPDGRPYGEALLDPSVIYVPVIDDLLSAGILPHYAAHITGHGWRKLMRAAEPFVYVMDRIPDPQPVFAFVQEHGPVTDAEAYGNLNMGAGFALYLDPADVPPAAAIAEGHGIAALAAGTVEKRGDEQRVIIRPKGLEFAGETLGVR
ncbi:MAG: phosphoribosylformylglycinamidine cyclo-ligase [Armatimonadetes bacterium]|nr:phosphoribosylformylglycinamidine cyclo-ligase [Armatimonadota bacterium]